MTLIGIWLLATVIMLSIMFPVVRYHERRLPLAFFQPQALQGASGDDQA